MKTISSAMLFVAVATVEAQGLPEIYVTEALIDDGGIYTVTINQPPSPPGPIWFVAAVGMTNPDATFVETGLTGWTGDVFDELAWNSQIPFETGTPGEPIALFTSGIDGLSDFDNLFGGDFFQAAFYWNESYIGNPIVATSSNFTWSAGTRLPAAAGGTMVASVYITSSVGDRLLCNVGVGASLPLECAPVAEADADGDGVPDATDNCTLATNPAQEDTDFDGFGNACDPDLNDDGIVNVADLNLFRAVFFTTDADADFNSDGVVNAADLTVLRELFFQPPGPSAGF